MHVVPLSIEITTTELDSGQKQVWYSDTLQVLGGVKPYNWEIISGKLPNNLQLNKNLGTILGTPTLQGTFDFGVKVSDSQIPPMADTSQVTIKIIPATDVLKTPKNVTPIEYDLFQNYPNPFNPQTTITFGLPQPSEIALSIFDANGRLVIELFKSKKEAGYHSVIWDASKYSTGTYFIRLQTGDFVQVRKCVLLR